MTSTAVDVRDLFRVHRTREGDAAALQGLTLRVERGEVLTVLGPSGAGKSTLLEVLAGFQTPSAGHAQVLGTELGTLAPRDRARFRADHLGLVDQDHARALPPSLPCLDGIALGSALRGLEAPARRARAEELLERVGLADRAQARPGELSGGERQRMAVCAALVHRPDLVLADEPGGELDAAAAAAVYRLLVDLAADSGASVVLVSHDPAATLIADRTVRLRDGRIAEERGADGEERLVVGRGGWVRLPEPLLSQAGLVGAHLHATATPGELHLTSVTKGSDPVVTPPPEARKDRPSEATSVTKGSDPFVTASLRGVVVVRGGRTVLDRFDLEVASGKLTALSGRSGSGKTTILQLLAGLARPDDGTITVADHALASLDRTALAELRRDHIGVLAQDSGLVDHLSARENVALALTIRGVQQGEANERAEHHLHAVGLAERVRQRVSRLSAGERQRVALARALAPQPGLLLADEPTSRLDEANSAAMAALLRQLTATTTVLVATHEPLVVEACDVVVEL